MSFIQHRLTLGMEQGRSYGYIWRETPNMVQLWLLLDKPMEIGG